MKELLAIQEKIFPDILDVMQRRYKILHYIKMMQPIGRRSLADFVEMKERVVRGEIDFLHDHGFIAVTAKGMKLTPEGLRMSEELSTFINEISKFRVLESQIKDKLQLEHVIVIPGNSDAHETVKEQLGKACVQYLSSILSAEQTVAITGGTTMSEVANMMTPLAHAKNCTFVPARGGLGEQVENQANTICAEMAKKANGKYRMLYVPDPLSEESYQTIKEEPAIKEIVELIHDAAVVIHGIGDAVTMAERRKASSTVMRKIKDKHAVSEAFGYYLDKNGEVVHKVRTVGLQLDDLKNANKVITVAGGKSKTQAILSFFKQAKSDVLITDEAAANQLLKGDSL
ncbi:sugar-binding transcriptional regulator [Saliterribacillus persicus]|uniref:Central glycolytic genes regulator n=1 Tax=Saliterribacillus persicus TaxID=930114 RepID=A0A368XGF1_9BACI|nr:sugar-binding domain-containing protein [Saliterribacillus persicus]RCW67043.1 central glycolytic genes regulator [Saliterribacillus persicus]